MATIQTRTQFKFAANDSTVSRILKKIASQQINITAFSLVKDKFNTVFLVVGPSDANNQSDNCMVRRILSAGNIPFYEKNVIQINFEAGIPGVFSKIYNVLYRKVGIEAIYNGEDNSLYLSVSNITRAMRILQKILS
ncbi:hypothetical protein QUF84_04950 [Fictibacillus enclensis]|uniref:hypothetical protein n=1 Tax=Fictibacillus TaxID=1329200 RepID=UPI0010132132|nr:MULTISPECIES: hypothetical protein [Fictibacillus]MDM5197421.1 hypothetical protein [Fictibacillus enclensis]MDM5336578.1 hypothetical protein [Fictibacillus enclensis]RXZ00522.1 hypothetical protein DMO16_13030 [Fictibacillus sp. S7]WHY73027.1 hypothetical protein QNH15_03580 [Fictibacillus enclensis]